MPSYADVLDRQECERDELGISINYFWLQGNSDRTVSNYTSETIGEWGSGGTGEKIFVYELFHRDSEITVRSSIIFHR